MKPDAVQVSKEITDRILFDLDTLEMRLQVADREVERLKQDFVEVDAHVSRLHAALEALGIKREEATT